MNSAHDLGGMQGFGPINPEKDEPFFHADWEKKVLALVLCMGACGKWNLDKSRHARESLPPHEYLSLSYYQIWHKALEKMMIKEGLVNAAELDSGKMIFDPIPVSGKLLAENVQTALYKGGPANRSLDSESFFKVGDKVRVKNFHPLTHTRAPRYVRGHVGEVLKAHGGFVFPDKNAHDEGESPKHLYTISFKSEDLWGENGKKGDLVMADLWEPYLEKA